MSQDAQSPTQVPEYKIKQREAERLANRGFLLRSMVKPGELLRDLNGRVYRIAPDGSWRRVGK